MTKKTRYLEPSLESIMYPEAWDLLARLANSDTTVSPCTAADARSRAASTLYSLGLCTDPARRAWRVTPKGERALAHRPTLVPGPLAPGQHAVRPVEARLEGDVLVQEFETEGGRRLQIRSKREPS